MKKKLFFLLTLLVCCVGQVWGASASYTLVTDASSLKSGDVIVIGCAAKDAAAGAMGTNAFLSSVSATIKDGVLTSDSAIEIALSGNAGGWTLTTSDGNIGATAAKKMALGKGTTTWTISIDADGTATISSTSSTYGRILYNVSSPRFLNYTSATSAAMLLPQIYKKGSVTPPTDELKSLTVSGTPTKTNYYAGEEFDPAGLTVTGTYSESGSKTVTSGITWTITPETLTVGTTSVSVVAKVGDVESSAYTVNGVTVIAPKTLTSIAIAGTPTKMEYKVGDAFDPAGLVVTGKYSDYSQEEITEGIDWIITPATFAEADVAASVLVVAKVGDIESSPYMATGLIVKERESQGEKVTLTFDMSKNPGDSWPTTNSTTLTNYTYTLDGENYTFALKNVKSNNGYLMLTATAALGLPAIPDYKLTKVVAENSSSCSTAVLVGVSASATSADYIEGGAAQKWATTKSLYTYNLTDTEANTVYYLYATSKNAQIVSLELIYESNTPSTDPSISASDVKIDADATSGAIEYTINNPVAGKTLTATTEASWISNIQVTDEKVTFTTTANTEATERSADITLKYEGATDKVVTVTQKAAAVALTTIDQIFAKATEAGKTATEVSIKFDGWYVTGVKGSNAYATDGTKGFIIYGSGHGFVVGDALNGTVTCKVQLYNGSAELTQLTTSTEGLTVTPNHSISAVEKTIDQLSGINTGAVVTIKNVTYDGANFTDGTNTFVPYNTLMTLPTFEENGKYNITGVYLQFNDKKEILPRSEADIESLATTKYTITWSVNGTTTDEEVNEGAAIDFTPATVPAGYTDYAFRGWTTESTVDAEPSYVTEATATADVTYYAVFARKTTTGGAASLTKLDGTSTLADGDKLAIFAHVGDNYYGMKHETISTSYVNYYVLDEEPTYEAVTENDLNWWTLNQEEENWTLGDEENGYLANSDNNLYADKDTGSYLTIAWDSENGAYTIKNGTRWIGCRSDLSGANQYKFRGAGNSTNPTSKSSCYLDIYRISTGTVTYSDFCTILPAGFELTIGETGYATFYDEVDRLIPNGVTAYYCEENASGSLKPVEITTGVIPAETGVILEGKAATYMLVEGDGTAEEIEGNCLMGVMVEYGTQDMIDALEFIYGAAPTIFVFAKKDGVLGFYKYTGTTLGAQKAFYATVSEAGINGFTLDFGGQTVGVGSVIRAANLKAGYDIQGRRINQMQKGINILNGKKIIK